MGVWKVLKHPKAEPEYDALDLREAVAVDNAIAKLEAAGPALPYPHSSNVQIAEDLRELRPRGGRSRTRALYRRFGAVFRDRCNRARGTGRPEGVQESRTRRGAASG